MPSLLGHLPREGAPGTLTYKSSRQLRYTLRMPSTQRRSAPSASTTALTTVFGEDEIRKLATSLYLLVRFNDKNEGELELQLRLLLHGLRNVPPRPTSDGAH